MNFIHLGNFTHRFSFSKYKIKWIIYHSFFFSSKIGFFFISFLRNDNSSTYNVIIGAKWQAYRWSAMWILHLSFFFSTYFPILKCFKIIQHPFIIHWNPILTNCLRDMKNVKHLMFSMHLTMNTLTRRNDHRV